MSEWQDIKLETAIEFKNGFAFKSSDFVDAGIPIVKIKNVKPNKINLDGLSYVKAEVADSKKDYLIKPTDILITMSGNRSDGSPDSWVGKVSLFRLKGNYLLNQRVSIIRAKEEKIDREFLAYNLSSWETQVHLINQANSSGGQANISPEIVKNLEISLPPIEEQKAIASVLSSLDDKIDLLHRQNTTLERMAETLFRQWFIEEAQEDWEEKPLKEVVDITIGRTPPRQEHQWFSEYEIDVKWISIKDLGNDGAFIFKTSEYLTKAAIAKFNIPVIPKDTVVLSFKMTVGRVAITTEEMLSNEAIAHFKFNTKTQFTKEYLFLYLKTYKYELLGSTSSIVTSINSAMIKDMEITIPNADLMSKFQKVTEPFFGKIKTNQQQIKTLEKLRDNLLPKLMSGEVRVDSTQ